MQAVLWGRDHVELGEVAVSEAGPAAAIALTRGRHAKRYAYTDPNEDVVAAVTGERATLLVCADGHNGVGAAEHAVAAVLAELGEDPPAEMAGSDWPALFGRVNDTVSKAVRQSEAPQSRAVLVVALVSGTSVSFGALGDAALVVCRPGDQRGRQLNREAMRFVGHPMGRRALRELVSCGVEPLASGEWVVLVTDGLSEFTSPLHPADVVPRVLARAASAGDLTPALAARAVVDAAGEAGAGDNVGVAVRAPVP